MRKPRIIFYEKPSKLLSFSKVLKPLGWVAFKILETALPILPILLIIGIFLLPETPHLRWEYEYQKVGQERHYVHCDYLGVHGTVKIYASDCPVIAFFKKGNQS